MTSQDENTSLKPASATTSGLSVVNASVDITGLDDINFSPSKSKSTVPMGDDAVVELPSTVKPPTEGCESDDDAPPLNDSNSAVSTEDDTSVEPQSTTEPPATELNDVDNIPPLNKSNSAVATKDDTVVEPQLTTEPPATELDDADNIPLLNKSSSAVTAKDDTVVEPQLTTEPPATKLGRDDDALLPNKRSKLMDQQTDDEDCRSPSTTELHPPPVNGFKDFTRYSECSRFDEAGERISKCTSVMMVDPDNYAAWLGTVDAPNAQVELRQAAECLCRVPDKAIYPPVTPDMRSIAVSDYTPDEDTWLKRPLIHAYKKGGSSTRIADLFLDEIKAHQLVEEHPHRNLVKFKACLEKDGLVVGVLQKHYPMTLEFRVEAWSQPPYDATAFYNDIEAGLEHLHSLGFAHNDLNPNNVMVDAEDRLIIIDLGAAMPLGQLLHQGGTAGWNHGFEEKSSVANDEIGLRQMKEYLQEHRKKE
ncbi:hypothetical protein CEP53_004496 [Fusarium sp. AF-6]|nr:hypothetical protein CEP53_004496 [Fusarium sp. AF-6]